MCVEYAESYDEYEYADESTYDEYDEYEYDGEYGILKLGLSEQLNLEELRMKEFVFTLKRKGEELRDKIRNCLLYL